MARPKKIIDEKMLENLAKIHCTMNEMSACLGVSVDTLERRYADLIKKAKEEGKASLRRYQYLAAQKGSIPMMIWLGKQLLGQKEPRDLPPDLPVDAQKQLTDLGAKVVEALKDSIK